MLVVWHVSKTECLTPALLIYGELADEDAIRDVVELSPAPVEVDWWLMQFADVEVV